MYRDRMDGDRMDGVEPARREEGGFAAVTPKSAGSESATRKRHFLGRVVGAAFIVVVGVSSLAALRLITASGAGTADAQAPPPTATPAAVAVVEERDVAIWNEFSGRLEAVERVEVRSRVAGAVQTVHFREGGLVDTGELLVTIDPAPYAAEVERRQAEVAAARARMVLASKEFSRGRQLFESGSSAIPESNLDQRASVHQEAEAALRAAEAALEAAQLDLGYTQIRAPVPGRVGKLEVTVGNLVAAGPGAPVLTTLVSVDPIYASFSADEEVVMRALSSLGASRDRPAEVGRIPVQMTTLAADQAPVLGRLQFIDNQFDAASGTVRVRAVFNNLDGDLIPGQFARLRMGQAETEPAILVSERAIGTDQDKKFVLVVDAENRAAYREVKLGDSVEGLRVVTEGLEPGERVIVSGLQHVRPGAMVAPETVAMDGKAPQREATASDVAQR